jgi:RNA polymerase sigma-70 factor, ECF subfamily
MVDELYARHSRAVYRRAHQLLGDAEAARDVTHDVFVRIIRGRNAVPPRPRATAWFYRVTTNLCLNRMRDNNRRATLLARHLPLCEVQPVAETRVTLAAILGQVSEQAQDMAVYYFLDDHTYDEIARLTGVSRRTVGNRLAAFRESVDRFGSIAVAESR